MDIEVIHNPDRLPCRKVLKVTNTVQAYKRIQAAQEGGKRARGLRIRYTTDNYKKTLTLEARHYEAIRVTERCLKDGGFIRNG